MLVEIGDTGESESLQARFAAMRERKLDAQKRRAAADAALRKPRRSQEERDALRALFVERAGSYVGVPYSKKLCGGEASLYLDCCALVRRCLLDLKEEFGFKVGTWNQSYQFDTLPLELSGPSEMKPGDLVFWSATYNDPTRARRTHDLVHVEIFVGGETGEATIGSRSTDPESAQAVAHHATYRSYAANCTASHDHKIFFRSIDTWLDGVCVSHCKACAWAEPRLAGTSTSKKYSLFRGAEEEADENRFVTNGKTDNSDASAPAMCEPTEDNDSAM